MRKAYLFLLLLLSAPIWGFGQTYGNEWIDYSQRYYKIKVIKDGMYRIDSAALAASGITVKNIDPKNFQIFFRGKEQYIYVQNKIPGVFGRNDFIEFYGQHNDGALDTMVYTGIAFNPNPYYSMFNDTSTYYLTWNTSVSNHRMTETGNTSYSGPSSKYFTAETVNYGNQEFYGGARYVVGDLTNSDPHYTQAEGWFNIELDLGAVEAYNLNISNVDTSGPKATISTVVIGESNSQLPKDHHLRVYASWYNHAATAVYDTLFDNNFPIFKKTFSVAPGKLTGSVYMNYVSATDSLPFGLNSNITAISYIYASYPHDTNMGGASNFMMYVPSGAFNYYNLSNLTIAGGDSVLFYDFTNHNRLKVTQSGSRVQVNVLGNNSRQCYLTTVNQVIHVTKLIPAGNAGTFTRFVPSTRSQPYIIIAASALMHQAATYATYRSQNFEVILANVEELYDQFGYGVEKDPLGIRDFCKYAVNTWRVPPAYLFLIGKGLHTPLYRQDTTNYKECLLPSFGYPSSDVLLSAGITNNTVIPAIPTGRLAAQTGTDVTTYLNKVWTHDTTRHALWMKNVIHFCGGSSAGEISQFQYYLDTYAAYIKNPYFGGNVYTFKKSNSQPIQITIADSVRNLINNGVSMMTFFGHASGNSFDVSLDAPSDYNNVGKYPMIIANACFSGDIFQPPGAGQSSTSEEFVLDQKGSIGFLAMDDLGIAGELYAYTLPLYRNIGHDMYRKSIGLCIQNAISQVQGFGDQQETFTCAEMTLHGDPAIAINYGDSLPDYQVTDSSVYFLPANVTTQMDSFKVKVVVTNIGEAIGAPVQLSLVRTFPNGTTATYNNTFVNLYYSDTATFTLPVNKAIGVGENWFLATIDPSNLIRELSETNNSNNRSNSKGTLLWITSGDIIPVLPYNFAIIPRDTVTLKASTGNPYAPPRNYIFQIDTTDNFNSPWLKSQIVYAAGGVVCASPYNWQNTPAPIPNWNNGNNQNAFNAGAINANNSGNHENGLHGQAIQPNIQQGKTNQAVPSMGVKPNNVNAANPSAPNNAFNPRSPGKSGFANANMVGTGNTEGIIKVAHHANGVPSFVFTDSTVYYWRVRYDSGSYSQHPWQESSFQYIRGKTGWGQSHIFQFKNNLYSYMGINLQPRNWSYVQAGKTLECDVYGVPITQPNFQNALYGTGYKLDIATTGSNTCQQTPAIGVVVIDQLSLDPWYPGTYNFNQANTNNNPYGCYPGGKPFIFWDTSFTQMNGLINLLNAVPKGDYILAYSLFDGYFSQWKDTAAKTAFLRLLPTSQIKNPLIAKDTVPWMFFVQKGGTGVEKLGQNANDSIVYKTNLLNRLYFGSMVSSLIGPAQKWDSLSWSQHPWKGSGADSVRLNVMGVDQYGNSKTLLPGVTPQVATMYLHSISAQQYPYLQFMLYSKDTVVREPSQMRKWQVFYTPVPEVAVNPSIYSYFHTDSLQAGDSIYYKTVVQNISDYPIDSMVYHSWIIDAANATHNLPSQIAKHLNPGDTTMIRIKAPSAGYYGNNSVWMEINPLYQNITRLEQEHFNDLTRQYFYVIGDKINPLLDVTFDGIHILNNDIVSSAPNIVMQLMDENKFLALNDQNDFAVFIRNINDPTPTKVLFGPQLTFTPAVLPKNSCKLNYTPALSDGTYELTVQAKDRSGNVSGANSYLVDFQVISKPMISNVLNYPNPFSTSTRFVFTLTGNQVPTLFTIQIMTVTGRVVKEITQDQIGPLHIGRNITEYAWDGTDQFGDKLANGIYLYRIITSLDGQAIDHFSTDADQYFVKGMGKMYLIR